MVRYSAEELERQFKQVAGIRKGKKEFKDDATYWDGGQCNWGGSHNLKEDCETLAKAFNQIESLNEIKKDLQKCTSSQEYEAKKNNYIRKCEGILQGLQTKTSSSSSMFGICIIWANEATSKHVISKLDVCRKGLTKLKKDLEKETYKWVQEIKLLKLEQKQIQKKMEENKKKAMDKNIDPAEKALLLQLIEEDGKKLTANFEKQKEIDKKFKYEPSQYVSDLLSKMKEAIEKRRNNPNPRNPRNSENSTDSEDSESDDDIPPEEDRTVPNNNDQPTNWWKENKELIILGSIALSIVLYFYYQEQAKESESNYYYDY